MTVLHVRRRDRGTSDRQVLHGRQIHAGDGCGATVSVAPATRTTWDSSNSRGRQRGARIRGWKLRFRRTRAAHARTGRSLPSDQLAWSPAMAGWPGRGDRGRRRTGSMNISWIERECRQRRWDVVGDIVGRRVDREDERRGGRPTRYRHLGRILGVVIHCSQRRLRREVRLLWCSHRHGRHHDSLCPGPRCHETKIGSPSTDKKIRSALVHTLNVVGLQAAEDFPTTGWGTSRTRAGGRHSGRDGIDDRATKPESTGIAG